MYENYDAQLYFNAFEWRNFTKSPSSYNALFDERLKSGLHFVYEPMFALTSINRLNLVNSMVIVTGYCLCVSVMCDFMWTLNRIEPYLLLNFIVSKTPRCLFTRTPAQILSLHADSRHNSHSAANRKLSASRWTGIHWKEKEKNVRDKRLQK